jgi:hypothetical protein
MEWVLPVLLGFGTRRHANVDFRSNAAHLLTRTDGHTACTPIRNGVEHVLRSATPSARL